MSSCSEYECCPRRYRYQYIDHTPAPRLVPPAWRYGSVVHRALEAAYRKVEGGEALVDALPDARAALRQAWLDEDMPDDPDWFDRADRVVTAAIRGDTIGPGDVLGVERGFRATLPDGLRFTGFADLVLRREPGVIEIIDHKVTRSVTTSRKLERDDQLNLYGWFALQAWPDTQVVKASHHYPLTRSMVITTLDYTSMVATVDRLAAVARAAEADREMAPTPGDHCGHCPWADVCEAWN